MGKFSKRRGDGARGGRDSNRNRQGGRADERNDRRGGRDQQGSDSRQGPRKSSEGKRRQRGGSGSGDALRVEKRDQSKTIKKANKGGPKKISMDKLRKEGGRNTSKDDNRGNKKSLVIGKKGAKGGKKSLGKKGEKGGKKGAKALPKDPAAKLDALDKDLESYWMKGGHSDLAKARLDDDLDGYFAKQKDVAETEADAAKEEASNPAAATEEKKE